MRAKLIALLLLPVLVALATAAPRLKNEKTYKAHQKIVLRAEDVTSKAAQFLWDIDGDHEVEVEEVGEKLYVWAPPGRYKVTLTAVDFETKKIERARTSFTVESNGPGPSPGPTPPGPTPPGPQPTALEKAVRDAYAVDTDADRNKLTKALAEVYTASAARVEKDRPATMGAVWTPMAADAKAKGVSGRITVIQKAVQSEWKKLPAKSTDALDDGKRALIVATYKDIAQALEKAALAGRKR